MQRAIRAQGAFLLQLRLGLSFGQLSSERNIYSLVFEKISTKSKLAASSELVAAACNPLYRQPIQQKSYVLTAPVDRDLKRSPRTRRRRGARASAGDGLDSRAVEASIAGASGQAHLRDAAFGGDGKGNDSGSA